MKLIELGRGLVTRVDDDVYKFICKYNWKAAYCLTDNRKYYHARASVDGKNIILHRFIMNCPKDMVVDHINGDGLDNRRENLRICTQSQNCANRHFTTKSVQKHRFKGICYYEQPRCIKDGNSKKWKARIGVSGRRIHLGWFSEPEEAARAYDKAAKKYFGEFANLNFKESYGRI